MDLVHEIKRTLLLLWNKPREHLNIRHKYNTLIV